MSEYKTFKELKEELGDKFEDYMYKSNIELLNQLQQKENTIKEVREYITSYESINTIQQIEKPDKNINLDGRTMKVMIDRYLKVHDKILEILDKVSDKK